MKSTFNPLIYILKLILNVKIETNFLNPQLNLIALMLNFEMKWKLKKYQKVRTIQNVIETLHRKAKSIPRIYTPQYMHLVHTLK
jgi:hypothetical protein